jgi:hypothetical protein
MCYQEKRKEQQMVTVGQEYTTTVSQVTGIIKEIVETNTGSLRLRLDVNGETRWTTLKRS